MTQPITPTQADREAAAANIVARLKMQHGGEQPWMDASTASMRMGEQDNHWEVQAFARHAAEAREGALEEAAKVCEDQQAVFASDKYATGQPMSSFGERFACGRCAEEIRALTIAGGRG